VVLPDHFFRFGVVQASLEFPFYNFMFRQMKYIQGLKMRVIGLPDHLKRIKTILNQTLLGPSRWEMRKWGVKPETIDMLIAESAFIAIKNPAGDILQIEDLVETIPFVNDKVVFENGTLITRFGEGRFAVTDAGENLEADIDLKAPQEPPLPIHLADRPIPRPTFGAYVIGCSSGFDPAGYTTGYLLYVNSIPLLVDAVAWLNQHLARIGVSPDEIHASIVTHIHEDHSNLVGKLLDGRRVAIITFLPIFRSLLKKIASILNIDEQDSAKLLNFIEVNPDQPFRWYGAEFRFWYTVHPIPTLGFRVTLDGHSIVFSGDTMYGDQLDPMVSGGIISEERRSFIHELPFLPADLNIFDAGGGLIHPVISELSKLPWETRKKLVLNQVENPPAPQDREYNVAAPGQFWEILPSPIMKLDDIMAVIEAPIMQVSDTNWWRVLLSRGRICEIPAQSVIIQQNAPGDKFYVILTGTAAVIDKHQILVHISRGDFFGEIALLENIPRTASIQATSSVKLFEIDKDVFLQFAKETGVAERLRKIYQIRPALLHVTLFSQLTPSLLNWVIEKSHEEYFRPGEVIIREGDIGDRFYIIVDGKVDVTLKDEPVKVATLGKGDCFGEMALLTQRRRTATVTAASIVQLFSFTEDTLQELLQKAPSVSYHLGILAKRRTMELSQIKKRAWT
jgi:CRP-like cAMP-binding protein/ribonuclease BN (tRNA processing enzyme)